MSRVENYGNAAHPSTADLNDDGVNALGGNDAASGTRDYGNNEYAQIYLPAEGSVTPVMLGVGTGTDV